MDPKVSYPMLSAPPASAATSLRCPGADERLPRLDEHLLPEDSPYEILDGQRILCMAEPDHAGPQARLAAVLTFHAAPGYYALVELTTRADTAPPPPDLDPDARELPRSVQELRSDACILKEGSDLRTGDRYVEDLSFEVAHTQAPANLKRKAELLRARGVRRVFALLVKKRQVVEWSTERQDFLPVVGEIRDPCLRQPLRIKALLEATEAELAVLQALLGKDDPQLDNAAAQTLLDKGNPLLAAHEAQIRTNELRQAITDLCDVIGIEMTASRQRQLEQTDLTGLHALRAHLKQHRAWPAG